MLRKLSEDFLMAGELSYDPNFNFYHPSPICHYEPVEMDSPPNFIENFPTPQKNGYTSQEDELLITMVQ